MAAPDVASAPATTQTEEQAIGKRKRSPEVTTVENGTVNGVSKEPFQQTVEAFQDMLKDILEVLKE
jgi:hypothetical protein